MSDLRESPNRPRGRSLLHSTFEQVVAHTLSQWNLSYFKGTHTCARPFPLSRDRRAWVDHAAPEESKYRRRTQQYVRHRERQRRLPCILRIDARVSAYSCIMHRFALTVRYWTSENFRAFQWCRHPRDNGALRIAFGFIVSETQVTLQRCDDSGYNWVHRELGKSCDVTAKQNETDVTEMRYTCKINFTFVGRVVTQREKNGDVRIQNSTPEK